MEEIIQIFSDANLNWITVCAVISGILYIILAAKENVWCWLAASISVCLYMYINYDLGYYSQAVLQIFYLFMAIYGYVMWNKLDPERIKEWSAKKHLFIIFIGSIINVVDATSESIWPSAADSDTITLNGTTTGGIAGDYFEIIDIATGIFFIKALSKSTGTAATPFSAAV